MNGLSTAPALEALKALRQRMSEALPETERETSDEMLVAAAIRLVRAVTGDHESRIWEIAQVLGDLGVVLERFHEAMLCAKHGAEPRETALEYEGGAS